MAKKLTRKQFDEKFARALVLQEEIKKREDELAGIKDEVKQYFKLPKSEAEQIQGLEFLANKTPVNKGANKYNAEALRKALPAELKDILTPMVASTNTESIKDALKLGTVTEAFLSTYRLNNWTFNLTFKRKEKSSQNLAKKAKKAATSSPIIPDIASEIASERAAQN